MRFCSCVHWIINETLICVTFFCKFLLKNISTYLFKVGGWQRKKDVTDTLDVLVITNLSTTLTFWGKNTYQTPQQKSNRDFIFSLSRISAWTRNFFPTTASPFLRQVLIPGEWRLSSSTDSPQPHMITASRTWGRHFWKKYMYSIQWSL